MSTPELLVLDMRLGGAAAEPDVVVPVKNLTS